MNMKKSSAASEFDAFSEPMKAARRWIDAMAAAGKKPIAYPESLNGLGWTWEELGEAVGTYRDARSHERSDEAPGVLSEWLRLALGDEQAASVIAPKISWCFSDSEFEPDSGCFIHLWPTDAPSLEIEALEMPAPDGAQEEMEGVWSLNYGSQDEAQAMQDVWDALEEQGYFFNEAAQRDPQDTAYAYAIDDPDELWERVESSIGSLRARKEAKAVTTATNKGAPSKSKGGL